MKFKTETPKTSKPIVIGSAIAAVHSRTGCWIDKEGVNLLKLIISLLFCGLNPFLKSCLSWVHLITLERAETVGF